MHSRSNSRHASRTDHEIFRSEITSGQFVRAGRTGTPSPPPEARAAANDESNAHPQRAKEPPGPLWVIAIAMAVFFGATALLMMFD